MKVVKQPQSPQKPKVDPAILKAISLVLITLISWLNPEATIAIALIKLLFILLEWLNTHYKAIARNTAVRKFRK